MSNRCRPVVEWPSRDRAAWAAAFIPGDPLAPSGLASQWASVSCRLIENGYGRWITWLDERGELDPLAAPEARITHERVKAFAADPEHVRIIAVILGQSTLAIAEKHYIQAQGLEAGRRYLRTIEALTNRTARTSNRRN
jgi:hypothetical protein